MVFFTTATITAVTMSPTQTVKICSVGGCGRPASSRGWCRAHYTRWEYDGDLKPDRPIGDRSGMGGLPRGNYNDFGVKECLRGHFAPRTKYGACQECVKERNRRRVRERQERLNNLAMSLGKDSTICERCGKTQDEAGAGGLHWHHRDPSTKNFNLGDCGGPDPAKRTDDEVLAELSLCERACRACHTYLHSVTSKGSIAKSGKAQTWQLVMNFRSLETAERAKQILLNFRREAGEV